MAQINFPAASESPWYNPDNGVTYEYIGGTWRTVTTASQLDDIYVKEIGDTMTGELILHGNPAQELGATPKQYVDNAISDSEGGETGRLDGRYLRRDSGAGAQTVASTGTTTFNGLVEAGNGVSVNNNNINLLSNGRAEFGGVGTFKAGLTSAAGAGGWIQAQSFRAANDAACIRANPDLSTAPNTYEIKLFDAAPSGDTGSASSLVGFRASNTLNNKADSVYGFYSSIDASDNTFNFYANGDAPNFLQGDTHIGGTASRSTRELWESTLTEEQKEQLEAGTLAIPANVSTPGDGEFARQYWYNKQSTRRQALIDSGELEYPVQLRPDSFNNTFELGLDTNIDFFADTGDAFFNGYVDVTEELYVGSDVEVSGSVEAGSFNATGTAPNYFAGELTIATRPDPDPTVSNYCRISGNRFLSQNNSAANASYNAVFRRQTDGQYMTFGYYDGENSQQENIGDISRVGDNIAIAGLTGAALILDQGADARNITNTAAISNASAVIQQLNPVRINNERFGFTAADLQPVVSEAVVGTANETLSIGTLYDFDGTVLETEVTEPPVEAQSYVTEEGETRVKSWTPTGTRPVYQGVDQTKLIPLLTKALQEALERIEQLEADHATMMNNNNGGY